VPLDRDDSDKKNVDDLGENQPTNTAYEQVFVVL
jgi:hypothetical protein